jgi:hypothetical protein
MDDEINIIWDVKLQVSAVGVRDKPNFHVLFPNDGGDTNGIKRRAF